MVEQLGQSMGLEQLGQTMGRQPLGLEQLGLASLVVI